MSHFPFLQELVLKGIYSAYWVVWPMSIDRVRAMLPPELKLGKQQITPSDTHPILFGFGQHQHASLSQFQLLFHDVSYLESSVSIPFVQLAEINKPALVEQDFLYIAQLNLDNPLAIFGGDVFWGFTKEMACFNVGNPFFPTYEVSSFPWRDPLMQLDFEVTGQYQSASSFNNFETIKSLMNQPLILKTLFGAGPYVYANFIWNFAEAMIRPIQAEVKIANPFIPGLQAGSHYIIKGIDQVELGAFQMINSWVLQLPSLT